jgi:hypothetical protein
LAPQRARARRSGPKRSERSAPTRAYRRGIRSNEGLVANPHPPLNDTK